MELSFVSVAIFASFIITLYYVLSKKRPKDFPPGPTGIPILGNVLQLGKHGHKVALELADTYGDIIGLQMGSRWAVILNNVDDIRDAFSRSEFAGRSLYIPLFDESSNENSRGVVLSVGRIWTEQRRFCVKTLRDFGSGRRSMENLILEEVNDLIEELKKTTARSFSTEQVFHCPSFNVIWSLVAGERFPLDDPQLQELIRLITEGMAASLDGITPFYFLFPNLLKFRQKFPFLFPDGQKFKRNVFDLFQNTVEFHKNTMEDGNPRDVIDCYLEEMKKTTDETSSFFSEGSDDNALFALLTDLFLGGAEGISTTLIWSFFLLALHKNVQDKLYHEIGAVVGNRQVNLGDTESLPYTEATIMEIMRVSTITPLGAPRAATQDTTFKNFFIPKDTNIFANLYAAHYQTSVWGDPENFRPERFLSPDGKIVLKNKNLIPFSVGKRVCLGEALARNGVFLFLTNLVQTFDIGMPDDEPEHTLYLMPGIMSSPEPHKIVLKERNP